MTNKKIILLVLLLSVVVFIAIINSKKDEIRQEDIKVYSEKYLPEKTAKCLKKRGYSVKDPSPEHKKECEAYAKEALRELLILNSSTN